MRGLPAPKIAMVAAKPKAPPYPKLAEVRVKQLKNNSFKVTHMMAHGHTQEFSFQNPALMVRHLKRIKETQWLHPGEDPAKRVTSVLDLGEPA